MSKMKCDTPRLADNGDGTTEKISNPDAAHWHREGDPFKRQFMSSGTHGPGSFLYDEDLWGELRRIVARELSFTDDRHLVRLRVDIELSH